MKEFLKAHTTALREARQWVHFRSHADNVVDAYLESMVEQGFFPEAKEYLDTIELDEVDPDDEFPCAPV